VTLSSASEYYYNAEVLISAENKCRKHLVQRCSHLSAELFALRGMFVENVRFTDTEIVRKFVVQYINFHYAMNDVVLYSGSAC